MANITITRGSTLPDSASKADFHNLVDNATGTVTNVAGADISSSAGIVGTQLSSNADILDTQLHQITTASKVHGSSLTGLASIPSGAGVIPSANLPSAIAKFQRNEMLVSQASSTTITVGVGDLEVNGVLVSKTSPTTLTLTTGANWAGGTSLQAPGTYGYVGVDASGNIKMHTTAPSHSDYAVSVTAGTKRFATWSSTVYRITGWFYMNATGSGELNAWEVGNLKDGSVSNCVILQSASSQNLTSGSYADIDNSTVHFYSSGRQVLGNYEISSTVTGVSSAVTGLYTIQDLDSSNVSASEKIAGGAQIGYSQQASNSYLHKPAQGPHTYKIQYKIHGSTAMSAGNRTFILDEK